MLEIGTLLQDRFLIEERIGTGGMGAVYLATDRKFGSRVAIKQTIYDNLELTEAFQREARLLNSLHHPVLPHVSDFFSQDGELMLVMEYIEGDDLSEILKRGEKLAVDDVVRWTFEILDALDYLHSQEPPIIHRDIKPNNLKLTPRGNVVLLDFGLAKETSGNTLGMRSVFGYSRRYSPLEQIEGTGTDERSDIFSLGATIYHLLTGEPPVDVLARASAIVAGRGDPIQLASELNNAVPSGFAAVIRSALALNPHDRFVSAGAMRSAIEFAMGDDSEPAAIAAEPAVAASINEVESGAAPSALFDGTNSEKVSGDPADPAIHEPAAAPIRASNVRRRPAKLVPLFAAGGIFAASVVGIGIYRSSSPSTETEVQPSSVPVPAANVQNTVEMTSQTDDQAPVAEQERHGDEVVGAAPSKAGSIRSDKKSKPVERGSNSVETVADGPKIANEPALGRPRIVKAPPRRVQRADDGAPVYTIESIFSGEQDRRRRNDISDEERMYRRRMRQMRRNGQMPPY